MKKPKISLFTKYPYKGDFAFYLIPNLWCWNNISFFTINLSWLFFTVDITWVKEMPEETESYECPTCGHEHWDD